MTLPAHDVAGTRNANGLALGVRGAAFVRRNQAVAVEIERIQRQGGSRDLLRGKDAVVIGIEGREHGAQRAMRRGSGRNGFSASEDSGAEGERGEEEAKAAGHEKSSSPESAALRRERQSYTDAALNTLQDAAIVRDRLTLRTLLLSAC
jgi:hypothetical protein